MKKWEKTRRDTPWHAEGLEVRTESGQLVAVCTTKEAAQAVAMLPRLIAHVYVMVTEHERTGGAFYHPFLHDKTFWDATRAIAEEVGAEGDA